MLTKFLKDVLEQAPKIVTLPRIVRIGPAKMGSMKSHTAYNTAAFSATAVLLFLARYVSPGEAIPFSLSAVSSFLAIVLFLGVGFVVNLFASDRGTGAAGAERDSVSLSNKWASYLILNLIVLIVMYLALAYAANVATAGEESLISYVMLIANAPDSYSAISFSVVMLVALAASAIVHAIFYVSGKVLDGIGKSMGCLFTSAMLTGLLFYLFNFKMFVS